ncbi:hypothetical protein KI387_001421, partial [Taxus chinensis]
DVDGQGSYQPFTKYEEGTHQLSIDEPSRLHGTYQPSILDCQDMVPHFFNLYSQLYWLGESGCRKSVLDKSAWWGVPDLVYACQLRLMEDPHEFCSDVVKDTMIGWEDCGDGCVEDYNKSQFDSAVKVYSRRESHGAWSSAVKKTKAHLKCLKCREMLAVVEKRGVKAAMLLVCGWLEPQEGHMVGLLAFHLALAGEPQGALVITAFALSVRNGGNLKKAVNKSRSIYEKAKRFSPEVLDAVESESDAEVMSKIPVLAQAIKSRLSAMMDADAVSQAMSKYRPQAPFSDLVFITIATHSKVWRIFDCVEGHSDDKRDSKQGIKINYQSLVSGDLEELRFVFAKVVIETLYSTHDEEDQDPF